MGPKSSRIIQEEGCDVRVVHLDRINRARSESIPERDLERLALIYKLLGDPTRLRIALALNSGEMCVCDMAALLGLSESAVSHQIRRLKEASLVKGRREGQVLYYSLDDQHVVDLIQVGMDHIRE
ncbi:MAG: winged helix-turn-helix transcriptional regulator [Deltaproteobacteria bacterium]|nr:winged helix-turn-helix transcriptional regulator [Deltaproteobacteria bacterium]